MSPVLDLLGLYRPTRARGPAIPELRPRAPLPPDLSGPALLLLLVAVLCLLARLLGCGGGLLLVECDDAGPSPPPLDAGALEAGPEAGCEPSPSR